MTVAMDAMVVAIHIKYALSLNRHLTFYSLESLFMELHTEFFQWPLSRSGIYSVKSSLIQISTKT